MKPPELQHQAGEAPPSPPLSFRLARLAASLWRFRTLPLAVRLLARLPSPTVVSRPFFGFELLLDISRTNTHRLLYLDGERFLAERRLVRTLLEPGMRVVEVGANIGYFLLLIESGIGASGSVLCLEPEPTNREELERNIRHNHLRNVQVLPIAAGETDGMASLRPGINGVVTDDGTGTIEVPIRSLDSLVEGPVDFLKVDVEGHELQVLRGAEQLLANQRPTVIVEVHPGLLEPIESVRAIFDLLSRHYPEVEAYAPTVDAGLATRAISRYLGMKTLRRLPTLDRLSQACCDGRQSSPFWVVGLGRERAG